MSTSPLPRVAHNDEREQAIEAIADSISQPAMADTLQRKIVGPLEVWIDAEYRFRGFHHDGTDAAMALRIQADDIIRKYRDAGEILPEMVDELDKRWRYWIATMGSSALLEKTRHTESSGSGGKISKQKQDVKCWREMKEWAPIAQEYKKKHGRQYANRPVDFWAGVQRKIREGMKAKRIAKRDKREGYPSVDTIKRRIAKAL